MEQCVAHLSLRLAALCLTMLAIVQCRRCRLRRILLTGGLFWQLCLRLWRCDVWLLLGS